MTALLLGWLARSISDSDRTTFEAEADRTTEALRERVDTTITLLRGTAGMFAATREVTREEFAAYIAHLRLRERYPGIQGVGWSVRVRAAQLQVLQQGEPALRIWPSDPRPEYHTVVWIEPLDQRNQAALGFDMFTDATRRAAMERARDEAMASATGKVRLVQEIDSSEQQAGFLIYLPVYHGPVAPASPDARRASLRGFVYAPLRIGDLLRGVRGRDSGIDYALYDGVQADPERLLRSTRSAQAPAPQLRTTRRLVVAGRPWLIEVSSRPTFEARSQRHLLPWLALLCLLASALLSWITYVQARSRQAAEASALERADVAVRLRIASTQANARAADLERLSERLRDLDRRKDEFLAMLAHELRNPLAPIRSALEILQRAPEGPQAQRARDIAARQLRQLVRLVDDLLDVSRISRGKIALRRQRVPVAEPLQIAVEAARPGIEARRHHLHVAAVDPDWVVDGDPTRLAQILTNLLNNAATYTPEGGRIYVESARDGDCVRLTVRDTGIGIEPQRLSQIFDLFVQLGRAGTGGGLGIGLHLAARLAQMHGGRVEACSDGPGLGSRFVLVLPLAHR